MDLIKAQSIISDKSQHIAKKMRALFFLRNILTDESVKILCSSFNDKSVLLKHEVAYVLGQMRLESSIDTLISVLNNDQEDEIVRHEAGEALGNFMYRDDIVKALEKNSKCGRVPVEETCYLALQKIKENSDYISPCDSRDPALPLEGMDLEMAEKFFLDTKLCLYKKYQAMFYLRDLAMKGDKKSIDILGQGLKDKSSLFKHEISFVFGQIRSIESVKYLVECMKKEEEHGMVRHECAEALGIIGTEECLRELVKYQYSDCDILRESVEVAIDLHGYINTKEDIYCEVK
ncbi:deoxyhypusine hydroxylase (DOHH) [Vairimorpha necatrix]|uniref:Deoxyhypusine hydroxylase n=1 Tax=Vairimorpha necatrix TaxID=6039 RepID=A0AAX4JC42_9MICR